jgi:predicted RNA-binding protein with PIN domain
VGEDEDAVEPPLPDAVRQRVVNLASEVLGSLPYDQVPAPLRRVAKFAPARRAKLGGAEIRSLLQSSATFRQQVAERAVGNDTADNHDPIDRAVRAYLLRPAGWQADIEAAGRRLAVEQERSEIKRITARLAQAQEQLVSARADARQERERLRADIERLKAENAALRRRIGELREQLRTGEQAAQRDIAAARQASERADQARAASDAEARRLRARRTDVETALEGMRRAEREGRSLGTTRLRLLLDTLTDASAGLRRELALPPVDVRPGDVAGGLAPTSAAIVEPPPRALSDDDPAALEALLALPHAHLIVDGYNVSKLAWGALPLETQRTQLVRGLAALAARTGVETTVVFDGADLGSAPPVISAPRGVRVRFSAPGVLADDVIQQLVRAEPEGRPVVVVSSDREVMEAVRRPGVRPVPSAVLVKLLGR